MHYDFSLPVISARFIPVWRRNFLVWEKLAGASILGNIADPRVPMSLVASPRLKVVIVGGGFAGMLTALGLRKSACEVTLVNTVPSAMTELARSNELPAGVQTVFLAGEALVRLGLAEGEHEWSAQ